MSYCNELDCYKLGCLGHISVPFCVCVVVLFGFCVYLFFRTRVMKEMRATRAMRVRLNSLSLSLSFFLFSIWLFFFLIVKHGGSIFIKTNNPYQFGGIRSEITSGRGTRCENGCVVKENCFLVKQWFVCEHYQCSRTTVVLGRCIYCECNVRRGVPASERPKVYFFICCNLILIFNRTVCAAKRSPMWVVVSVSTECGMVVAAAAGSVAQWTILRLWRSKWALTVATGFGTIQTATWWCPTVWAQPMPTTR